MGEEDEDVLIIDQINNYYFCRRKDNYIISG